MAINEVVFEGETLMSTIGTTVTPETLAVGETAIDASGELITGVMTAGGGSPYAVLYTKQSLSAEQQSQARDNIGAYSYSEALADMENLSADIVASEVNAFKSAVKYTDEQLAEYSAVTYTGQALTPEQQAQARDNIGAYSFEEAVTAIDTLVSDMAIADEEILDVSKKYTDNKLSDYNAILSKATTDGDTNTLTSANSYADSILLDFMEDSFANLEGHVEEINNSFTEHTSNKANPHGVTKAQIGLGNVENKSSATIRSELTKDEVENALGYTVPTQNLATQTSAGLMSASDKVNLDKTIPQRIDTKVDKSTTVNGKALSGNISLSASDVKADASGTASAAVSTHNTNTSAHNDMRILINNLTTRLNALADSDDTTLDQMSEIVAYIKANKALIDSVTTNKINVSDIVNNLTTNVANKPLSAAQGVAIKALIDALRGDMSSISAVLYTEQSLSAEQQAQARDNIGAYSYREALTDMEALSEDIVASEVNAFESAVKYTDGRIEEQSKTITDGDADTLTSANSYADSILLDFMEDSFANLEGNVEEVKNSFAEHTSNKSNPHNVTKSQIGLGNVENKSSATIRSELTKGEVENALGYVAVPKPSTSTTNAVARYSNTTGDIKDSKIRIEDVTNSRDSSKKANVLVIPAEGDKKIVYGYCTDQIDGTSFIGGLFDNSATSYPHNEGLAIGGTSGNLLWKGSKVAVASDIPTKLPNPNKLTFTGVVSGSYDGSSATTINIPSIGGEKGDPGNDGVGISSVAQTTTSSADGGSNVVTVTLTDGTKSTFTVKNGSKGSAGTNGTNGKDGVSPTVSVSKSGKVTTLTITDVNGTKTATINDGVDGTGGTGESSIPDYVYTEAKAVASTINRHQSEDSIVFPFLADAHCGYYTDTENAATTLAGQLLDCIGKRVPYDFVANGGDMATGAWNTTKDNSFEQIEDYTEIIGSACKGTPYIWTAGNHDDSPYMATGERVTQAETFALIGRKNRLSGAVCPDGRNYGYLDLDNRKLRIIYLDTDDKRGWGTVAVGAGETSPDYLNAHNIGGDQLVWLANTALDFSEKSNASNWDIVIISHVPLNVSGSITDAVSGVVYDNNTQNAAKILSAYKRGNSGTITHNGVTASYDFSGIERASVICAVHGHNHKFTSENLLGDIVSIGCPNVMNGRERVSDDGNTYSKTAGTANGTSFCIITIDRVNSVIYADCVGVGYDREFTYTTEVVAYTNHIPISTDTDGTIYNGCGYKVDTYISSGAIGTRTGIYTTGFIPVSGGDVIRFKNCTITKGENNHRFAFYDANKNYIAQAQMNSSAVLQQVYDGTNIVQITLASFGGISDWSQVAYMRFCCGYIGEDSIATVNQEIPDDSGTGDSGGGEDTGGGSDATSYTNLLPLAIDTDGSIYNNIGYASNTYLSSSTGAASTRSGYFTSGFIPCTVGSNNVVRFKNITFDYDGAAPAYDRIAIYDANKTFLSMMNAANGNSYGGVVMDENGIWESFYFKTTTNNVDITNMAYFRFCCTYIGEDSIVTINEEITD